MKLLKSDIADVYSDGDVQSFESSKTMNPGLAYKIFRNLREIKAANLQVITDIDMLRMRYGLDQDISFQDLEPEKRIAYSQEYDSILSEEMDVDIVPIQISEIPWDVTVKEMHILHLMIGAGE